MLDKRSKWLSGLLYAESVGAEEATHQLYCNEFSDYRDDFERGVEDYLEHHKRLVLLSSSSGEEHGIR